MWSTLTDNLPTVIASLTALTAAIGAWLKLRPRRFIGWFTATKEREILRAMFENEHQWKLYWEAEATECLEHLKNRDH